MVNYRYDLKEIERNHEGYANDGFVAASRNVRGLLRSQGKPRALPQSEEAATSMLALPAVRRSVKKDPA